MKPINGIPVGLPMPDNAFSQNVIPSTIEMQQIDYLQ